MVKELNMQYEYFGFIKFASKEAIRSTDNGIVLSYQVPKEIEVTVNKQKHLQMVWSNF